MKHYKLGNAVYAFDENQSDLIQEGMVEMTDAEVEAYANPPESIEQQIDNAEISITPRNLRAAIGGDQYAIDKIAQVEILIAGLRAKL